jgi:predicted secreted protein
MVPWKLTLPSGSELLRNDRRASRSREHTTGVGFSPFPHL